MKRLCSVPGCKKVHLARGFCDTHRRSAARNGLIVPGIDHRGKLDPDKVRAIRALVPSMSQRAIAKLFGVDHSLIGQIDAALLHLTDGSMAPIAERFGVSTSAIHSAATGRTWVSVSQWGRASLQAGEVTGGAPQEQADLGHFGHPAEFLLPGEKRERNVSTFPRNCVVLRRRRAFF